MLGWENAAVGAGLAEESLAQLVAHGELGRQHLDGDGAVEGQVAREIDRAHAAAPQLAVDRVAGAERCLDLAAKFVGHRYVSRMPPVALMSLSAAPARVFAEEEISSVDALSCWAAAAISSAAAA